MRNIQISPIVAARVIRVLEEKAKQLRGWIGPNNSGPIEWKSELRNIEYDINVMKEQLREDDRG